MPTKPLSIELKAVHRRRLRELWRSAGWPCQDMVEVELLAAGLLERCRDEAGRETLRLTDAGITELAHTLQRNRGARNAHEALVQRVATEMQRAGRVVWRGLTLRAPLPGANEGRSTWAQAVPDVFSIRHTTVEDLVEPVVHEVKVRRADLLSELRHPDKSAAYAALASQMWFVLAEGVGDERDIPAAYGVMRARRASGAAHFGALEVLRPAPRRAMRLPFAVWMALARATAEPALDGEEQTRLIDPLSEEKGSGAQFAP